MAPTRMTPCPTLTWAPELSSSTLAATGALLVTKSGKSRRRSASSGSVRYDGAVKMRTWGGGAASSRGEVGDGSGGAGGSSGSSALGESGVSGPEATGVRRSFGSRKGSLMARVRSVGWRCGGTTGGARLAAGSGRSAGSSSSEDEGAEEASNGGDATPVDEASSSSKYDSECDRALTCSVKPRT